MGEEIGGGGGVSRFQPPPAFLTKTFNIVNDPNTNSIISWGESGNSFIIWDHIKFTAEILPNYFRHNNLSSFVYQLNNYGFRKIGVDHQWEYSHADFQAGKPHLLSNMRRRSYWQNPTQKRHRNSLWPQMLRNAIDESKHEISKLKMQYSDMDSHIMELEQGIKDIEAISEKTMVHWTKACEIVGKRKRLNDGAVSVSEKVVVAAAAAEETPPKNNDKNDDEYRSEMVKVNNIASLSEAEEILGDYMNDWKRILLEGDDEVCGVEDEGSEIAKQHSQIAKDFQEFLNQTSTSSTPWM